MHELLNRITRYVRPDTKGKLENRIERLEVELNDAMRWRALISNADNGWSIFVEKVMALMADEARVLREADVINDPVQQRRATQAQTIINTFTKLLNEAITLSAKAKSLQNTKKNLETELFNIETE